MGNDVFEKTIEESTGLSIRHIRETPLDELRREAEEKRGKPLRFVSFFPWVGRGSVMRDRLISHEEAEAAYDDAIRRLPK